MRPNMRKPAMHSRQCRLGLERSSHSLPIAHRRSAAQIVALFGYHSTAAPNALEITLESPCAASARSARWFHSVPQLRCTIVHLQAWREYGAAFRPGRAVLSV
jgi:hypothetical protein